MIPIVKLSDCSTDIMSPFNIIPKIQHICKCITNKLTKNTQCPFPSPGPNQLPFLQISISEFFTFKSIKYFTKNQD